MLECQSIFEAFRERGVSYFAGVPDSLLKDFCSYVTDHTEPGRHVITANEGGAIALATGHYLATGELSLVYMQNSGQGNCVNPLMSLTDPEVYGIPMLLLVGWRGEPGFHDEPQHVKQGKVTLPIFDAMGIPYTILPETEAEAAVCIEQSLRNTRASKSPVALVVRKGTFAKYKLQGTRANEYSLTREAAIQQVARSVDERGIIVSTTGMPSRELFEHRANSETGLGRDFLTVGAMGHASTIALGIAESKPDRQVYCLDGDGAFLMHMGALAVIGQQQPANFRHIVLNNGAHDSVGGQPTAAFSIDIPAVARACGYRWAAVAKSAEELTALLAESETQQGPTLIEVRVSRGNRPDLGRPTTTPEQNKQTFMEFVAT